jgi:hypothetical protein
MGFGKRSIWRDATILRRGCQFLRAYSAYLFLIEYLGLYPRL